MSQYIFIPKTRGELYPFVNSILRISEESKGAVSEEKLINILLKLDMSEDHVLQYLNENSLFSIVLSYRGVNSSKEPLHEIILREGVVVQTDNDDGLIVVIEKHVSYNYGEIINTRWKVRYNENTHKTLLRIIN